jgi:hypothetical protein
MAKVASAARLAPLAKTRRSQTRFLTRIGEYLASSRHIVTTKVGKPGRFLVDDVNAHAAGKPDPVSHGDAIVSAIQAGDGALVVGRSGRNLTAEEFDYLRWGECLGSLFACCSERARRGRPL